MHRPIQGGVQGKVEYLNNLREHISGTTRRNFTKFPVPVANGRVLIILWQCL